MNFFLISFALYISAILISWKISCKTNFHIGFPKLGNIVKIFLSNIVLLRTVSWTNTAKNSLTKISFVSWCSSYSDEYSLLFLGP